MKFLVVNGELIFNLNSRTIITNKLKILLILKPTNCNKIIENKFYY